MPPNRTSLRARSTEEFMQWINQALTEVDDLRDVISFSAAALQGGETFIDQLDAGLRTLRTSVGSGDHRYEDKDLPFMQTLQDTEALIPFRHLLLQINATHRKGIRAR